MPVAGSSRHNYCDGYLVVTFQQEIKVPAASKISYVLKITSLKLDTTGVIPPDEPYWSEVDTVCSFYAKCLADPKQQKRNAKGKVECNTLFYDADRDKKIDAQKLCAKWQQPTNETAVIPRLGLSPRLLRVAAERGLLNRDLKPVEFLLNTEPYYGGPAWSDCFVILHVDNNAEQVGNYCPHRFYTDYRNEAISAIVGAGVSKALAEKLVLMQDRKTTSR
jgi:hypothetical protein